MIRLTLVLILLAGTAEAKTQTAILAGGCF